MSLPWSQRKARLAYLLKIKNDEDEDAQSLALDRLLHGHNVIGKTKKSSEIEGLRINDRDFQELGTLEFGQFGVVHVVHCHLNGRVYVHKAIEKRFVLRNRDQCFPQFERDILLRATKTNSHWAPHLLCAFHTTTHVNLVMDYIDGGTLGDVLESSPLENRISEQDINWWAPQIVSAIHWCHTQDFVHRDIKPQNFVLTSTAHILLIDFGSSAPLLPAQADGSRMIPSKYCVVPCGTCDYISPEILKAHEEALVALEMNEASSFHDSYMSSDSEDVRSRAGNGKTVDVEGYGLETDWWSFGAMLYEMAFGVAPFFANDVQRTYLKIMDHQKYLRFDSCIAISTDLQHFIIRLLSHNEFRIGRGGIREIMGHPFFDNVSWLSLHTHPAPEGLHLPQFIYPDSNPAAASGAATSNIYSLHEETQNQSLSRGFAFSALFHSSTDMSVPHAAGQPTPTADGTRPCLPSATPSTLPYNSSINSMTSDDAAASFIGFSWGPTQSAFDDIHRTDSSSAMASLHAPSIMHAVHSTPNPNPQSRIPLSQTKTTPNPFLSIPSTTPRPPQYPYTTPSRYPYASYATPLRGPSFNVALGLGTITPFRTLPRGGTAGRPSTQGPRRRAFSDREALQQLINCVGMSARKKVLESGRKLKVLTRSFSMPADAGPSEGRKVSGSSTASSMMTAKQKELRELRFVPSPVNIEGWASSSQARRGGVPIIVTTSYVDGSTISGAGFVPQEEEDGTEADTEATSEGGSSLPPSPSPSPRPGSALSMMSMTRRSGTPGLTGTFNFPNYPGRMRSGSLGSVTMTRERERERSSRESAGLAVPNPTIWRTDVSTDAAAGGIMDPMVDDDKEQEDQTVDDSSTVSTSEASMIYLSRTPSRFIPRDMSTASHMTQNSPMDIPQHHYPPHPHTTYDKVDSLDMENRHRELMRDIGDIERRLTGLSALIIRT